MDPTIEINQLPDHRLAAFTFLRGVRVNRYRARVSGSDSRVLRPALPQFDDNQGQQGAKRHGQKEGRDGQDRR